MNAGSIDRIPEVGFATSCNWGLQYVSPESCSSEHTVADMRRVDCENFYRLGESLKPLHDIKADDLLVQHVFTLNSARSWVKWFLDGNIINLSVCQQSGRALID